MLDALTIHGAPVYVRRAIVHNLEVVRTLEAKGAVFVEEVSEVPEGAVIIFSAHGVAPSIAADASSRGLIAFDAVCPLVAKVHREVERHERAGRQVILIGHEGHPEIDGTLGHLRSSDAFVVKSVEDVEALPIDREAPAAYAVQTTYSISDAEEIVRALRARFSDLVGPPSSDICYATTNRQTVAREMAAKSDAVIVAGENFSSNAKRLAEVASASCHNVQLIARAAEIDWTQLPPSSGVIGVTAAASTPETTIHEIVQALSLRYRLTVEELQSVRETTVFKRLSIA